MTDRKDGQRRFNCPVASRCGGCQVEALLSPFCPVEPIRGMENPYHYRNKVHAVLAVDKRGLPVSGVYEAGTHRVVPVRRCLIEDRRADAVIQTIVGLLPRYRLRIYNGCTLRGFLRDSVIRTAQHTGQMMVVLVATGLEFPGGKAFVADLKAAHPEITTIVLNENNRRTSMVLGTRERVLDGPGYLEDTLCGCTFRISPQAFYQVNARQCEVLYRTAIDLMGLTGRETLLDAYCGTGTIGLCAAKNAARLIGVELNAQAVRDARENARRNGIANATFRCEDAGRFMARLAEQGERPDVVCMDPPRAGSDERFLSALIAMAPARIVYVSCCPETLARDLARLTAGGYRAERAVPVDMFPNTEHIETVVMLQKASPAPSAAD